VLVFSRPERQRRTAFDAGPVVAEALKLVRAVLPATVSLHFDSPPALPTVHGDPMQVHQVVVNLVTNAAQALGDRVGGVAVELATVRFDDAASMPSADLIPGEYVRLRVRDEGVGMDAATKARIFEPFFTTKAPGQGTGLGLSVVYGIVRGHHGALVVESAPGQGTIVDVYLPGHADAVPATDEAIATPPRGHGERILLVDDEVKLAELGQRTLERLGYRVTAHTSPIEAIASFRADPLAFDLLLTDVKMPVLSGTDLAAEVLRLRPGLPVVLSTGFDTEGMADAARRLGVRAILRKPLEAAALARAVDAALARA
jgi:CheY-like chemotaxis protein